MTKKPRKTGRPKELDPELDDPEHQSPKEFVQEFFQTGTSEQQGDLPSLEWLKDNYQTKSAAIRYLVSQGVPVKTIAKHLGIKYQHARNVATNKLKRGPNEDWRPKALREPQPLLPKGPTTDEDK